MRSNDASATPPPGLPRPVAATIPSWWRALVDAHGGREAARMDGRSLTYRDLDRRSADLARGLLARGVGKGTRIGLLAPNSPEWIIAWLAAGRIGALLIGVSTFFSPRELNYALRHADIAVLLAAPGYLRHDYADRLEQAVPSLAAASGAAPLALLDCPHLRAVWFNGPVDRRWAAGTFADLETAGAASSVFTDAFLDAIEDAVSPADRALVIYTSGSTAYPKGVIHTQGGVVRKTLFMCEGNGIIPSNTRLGDCVLMASPMFWVGGLLSLTGGLTLGAVSLCQDEHSPRALLDAVAREGVTHIVTQEAVLMLMRELEGEGGPLVGQLKSQNTGQAPFFRRAEGVPRERIPLSLGMTETMGPHSGDNEGGLLPAGVENSVGPALAGVEYKIIDLETGRPAAPGEPGELCVRTPWQMDGMYKRERSEVFDADGYYPTGDLCALSADGYLFYKSRIGGMIKTSGANVSPEEVEIAIRGDAAVVEAAVLGLPDRELGQRVVAVVALAPGASRTEAQVRERLRGELSAFKVPRRVFFMAHENIPRTASNKVRKPALAELIKGWLAASP